jgi:hypothetical protein
MRRQEHQERKEGKQREERRERDWEDRSEARKKRDERANKNGGEKCEEEERGDVRVRTLPTLISTVDPDFELAGDGLFEKDGDVVSHPHVEAVRSNLQNGDVDLTPSFEGELQVLWVVDSADVRTVHPGPEDTSLLNPPAEDGNPSARLGDVPRASGTAGLQLEIERDAVLMKLASPREVDGLTGRHE